MDNKKYKAKNKEVVKNKQLKNTDQKTGKTEDRTAIKKSPAK